MPSVPPRCASLCAEVRLLRCVAAPSFQVQQAEPWRGCSTLPNASHPSPAPPPIAGCAAGGPNYLAGLEMMRRLGGEIGVEIEVYGPVASMTGICQKAIDYIRQYDADGGGAVASQ